MTNILLQDIIEDIRLSSLPYNWNSFDFETFSRDKLLWDYQQTAVKNAIKVLWKFYEDFVDYYAGEPTDTNLIRKEKLMNWYRINGLEADLDINLRRQKHDIYNLLMDYYPCIDEKIPYENFINRMCFWMATGSGKTLIIIKLMYILYELVKRGEIPSCDMLILTHRDDLITQFKDFIEEFNQANETKFNLVELKQYPEVKRQPQLLGITVFYYRSDNLSDDQKEKIIDFRNYDNDGRWYVFLDEAHKGDREESKRQQIYSIISRNGFLFNSSATFIDPRDIVTCAFEFNLSRFINSGYGKHISILKQEFKPFRDNTDYTGSEKQKIVLKSLILLTYIKKIYNKIKQIQYGLYHNPLLLTLVNSVNTEEADLKLFFREIEKIGKGEINDTIFREAQNELWKELSAEPAYIFENGIKVKIDEKILRITKKDILRMVYNSQTFGPIEISFKPSDKKQVAFKLVTSDKHFALMKTGDMPKWLKEELARFNINHRFEEEGFFERINQDDSDINILMGSRAFYEGWDSNRPNVINFINIGIGGEARKFILQSVGRGVRIEPIQDRRKRLLQLYNSGEIDAELFNKIESIVKPIETLFIFGTKRDVLSSVIKRLEVEGKREGEAQISLFINKDAEKLPLLIPKYRIAKEPNLKERIQRKFEITEKELEEVRRYVDYIGDDRVFLMLYSEDFKNYDVEKIKMLKAGILQKDDFIRIGEQRYGRVDIAIKKIISYLGIYPTEFQELKLLTDEIRHFRNIKVYLKDIRDLQEKINRMRETRDPSELEKEIEEKFDRGLIDRNQYKSEIKKITKMVKEETVEYSGKRLRIKKIHRHYYLPLILIDALSDQEKVNYIKHIIRIPSEVKFINDLEQYLDTPGNVFEKFDWWLFSKLDETMDEVYIPYYNPNVNNYSHFYPDFVFWLKKGNKYTILFVDPKGTEHAAAMRKIDGYEELFGEPGKEKIFKYNGMNVRIKLRLRAIDTSKTPKKYEPYWFDNIKDIIKNI